MNLQTAAHFAGWQTPKVMDGERTSAAVRGRHDLKTGRRSLKGEAWMAGWPTPMAHEARLGYQRRDTGKKGTQESLSTVVVNGVGQKPHLSEHTVLRVNHLEHDLTSYSAATENGGQLNPELARWLMGFPAGWSICAATEARSTPTKGRCS
jgi:hypothetical protein